MENHYFSWVLVLADRPTAALERLIAGSAEDFDIDMTKIEKITATVVGTPRSDGGGKRGGRV